jgi:dipeptidyl aminopeptidase/acylaminoacyl peptidase
VPRVTPTMVAGGRVVGDPRLSPDGRLLAFVAAEGGSARLVLVDADGGPEVVLSSDPAPVGPRTLGGGAFDWAPDGSALAYAGGGRRGGLWWQPVTGGPPRCLVDGGSVAAPAVSPDGTRVAYGVGDRDVAVVAVDGAWPVRLTRGADFAMDPAWSADGTTVAWLEWDVPDMPWDGSRIVVAPADGSGEPTTVAGGAGVQVQQPRFSPDGRALAFLSDAGGWLNLVVRDLATAAERVLDEAHEHGGPTWGPGQRTFAWAPGSDALAVCRNETGFGSLQVWDPADGSLRRLGRAVHGGVSWQGDRVTAVRTGGVTPAQVVVYEGPGLADRRTVARGPLAGWEALGLPEPELVTWAADDGTELHGRLYRPMGTPEGDPPPLLTWVHGGPTDQWGIEFRPRLAYWMDRGWAVLVPDHRGSTGHGRAYTQAMAGRWGELDVADVAAAVRVVGERGWGDPRRVVAMGGSAGGFTVLNLLATHPALFAAGVDLYGVTDLFALSEVPHRYEAHYLHSLVGPLPERAEAYRDRSPVNRADAIVAPLLILQGSDDPVVPPAQSAALAARLTQLGRTVESHVYEGEGHGWGRAETVIDELQRTESFLRRHVLRWRAP